MRKLILLSCSALLLFACKNTPAKKNASPGSVSDGYATEETGGKSQDAAFNIEAPAGWTKSDTFLMGNRLTLLKSPQEVNDDFIENVNVISEKTGNMSLDEYFEKNLSTMQTGLTNYKENSHSDKTVNGIDFKNLKYSHVYNGRPIDVDAYLAVHKGNGYVITCSTPQGDLSKWQPVFDKIINSFSFN